MVTEFVSSDGVAISLADGEAGDIRGLVRLCLRSAGLRPWGDMEAELFESGSGCLLLASPFPAAAARYIPAAYQTLMLSLTKCSFIFLCPVL